MKPQELIKRKFSWSVTVFALTYSTDFKEYSEVLNFERERHFSPFYGELLYNKRIYKLKKVLYELVLYFYPISDKEVSIS